MNAATGTDGTGGNAGNAGGDGVGSTFQELPGASFVVSGAAASKDSALMSAAVETRWINGWSAMASFEGEFSDTTRSYAGKGMLRYAR